MTENIYIKTISPVWMETRKAVIPFFKNIIVNFQSVVAIFKNTGINFQNIIVIFKKSGNDFALKPAKNPATKLPGVIQRTWIKAEGYSAFLYSNVFNMWDKPFPGRKRSRAFLTSWEVTSSEVSLPPELMLTRRVPKSPMWTITPSSRSVMMFSSRAVSTAIQSAGRTVHWLEMRFDIFLKSVLPAVSAEA
ncbi:MAG TPA: hypothetical protein VGW31_00210 [Hanamia sp.]|nr:hypothetical protein [Hanamia sp.]